MKGIEGHYKAKGTDSPDKTEINMGTGHQTKTSHTSFQLNLQEIPEFWELCLPNDTLS